MSQASERRSMILPMINIVEIDHIDPVGEIDIKILKKKPMKIEPGEILDPPDVKPKTVQATVAATETATASPMSTTTTATASLIRKRGQNSQAMAQASKRRSMILTIINVVEIDHVDLVREINLVGLLTSKSRGQSSIQNA